MLEMLKRLLVGRKLATDEQEHQRIPKLIALPVFSSDAISSTAYASEEILFVIALGASSLALGLSRLVPIALGVAMLLAIVVVSYRRTIFAYPNGGGSYVVSRENFRSRLPSLIAGASILVDYILTVAVSVSAGVAAIVSIPSLRGLEDQRVALGLSLIAVITLMNLRGLKESGAVFAVPTYAYIGLLSLLIGYGLFREFLGTPLTNVPFDEAAFEGAREAGGTLGVFMLLKGFSSGAVALTGIEAIADGVPAFRKPASKNASITLMWMAVILGTLFFGTAVLAHHLHPYPSHDETVFSQMGRAVFGNGPLYVALQFATAAILTLAANTAYADFPRLASILAKDGYLPRQFANQGDRLVFSNGIVFLGLMASALIVVFGGITTALIPLYAVGVFTSFTLSQLGMVHYQRRKRARGWRLGAATSGFGASVTFGVLVVVATTKFTSGAYVPVIVLPLIIGAFLAIRRHYDRLESALAIRPGEVRRKAMVHTVVVLVGRVHRGVINAIHYAESLRPDHITALYIAYDDKDREAIENAWVDFGFTIPLELVTSPYRELPPAVEKFLDEVDDRWRSGTTTVVIPEFVAGKLFSLTNLLHNQSAAALKLALLYRPNTVVTSVPYHVDAAGPLEPTA